jgi:hypothetical protein
VSMLASHVCDNGCTLMTKDDGFVTKMKKSASRARRKKAPR